MRIAITLFSLLCAGAVCAQEAVRDIQKKPFEFYQVIIDRLPFGTMSDPSAAEVPVSATETEMQKSREELALKLVMCGVTVTPQDDVGIGFVDNTVNPAISYILAIGEKKNGFVLLDASYEKETATVKREEDGLVFTLKLGKGLIATDEAAEEGTAPAVAASGRSDRRADRRGASLAAAETAADAENAEEQLSFKERLQAREAAKTEAERAKQAAEDAARKVALEAEMTQKAAALVAAERRREEIERIKRGEEPTIPIKLTPEEDAELVREGVFQN